MRLRTQPLPAIHRVFPGVFYGWVIVFGTALLAFVSVGIGFYSQAVLVDALVEARGWQRSTVAAASSLFFLASALTGSVIGRQIDRFGARGFIVAGACLMAGALIAIGRVRDPFWLFPLFALMAIGFAQCTSVPQSAIITRWFIASRTRAMSVSQTGVSVGGIVLTPLAVWLIQTRDLETAMAALGVLLICVAGPVTIFVLRWDPGEHGLEPDGSAQPAARMSGAVLDAQRRVWSMGEVVRSSAFWLVALAFGCALFSQIGFLVHEVIYLRGFLDATVAAFAVSTTAAGSIVGRLLVGFFAEHFDKRRVTALLFVLQSAAVLCFSFVHAPLAIYTITFVFGLTMGNIFMFQSLLVGEIFGIPSFGSVFGALQLFTQLLSSAGPLGVALLSASLGYPSVYRLLAALSLLAAGIVSLLARTPDPAAQGRTV